MKTIWYIKRTLVGAAVGALLVSMVVGMFMAAASQADSPNWDLAKLTLAAGAAFGGLVGLAGAGIRALIETLSNRP